MACVYGVHLTHLSLSCLALSCPAYPSRLVLLFCLCPVLYGTGLDRALPPVQDLRYYDDTTIRRRGRRWERKGKPRHKSIHFPFLSPFPLPFLRSSPCSFLPSLFLVTPSPPPFSFSLHPPSRIMTCRDETSSVSQFKSSRAIRGVHYSLSSRLFSFFFFSFFWGVHIVPIYID